MANITYPHATLVRQLLDYDPATGAFLWKERPSSMFLDGVQTSQHNCNIWNGKFAGKPAGCVTRDGYHKIRINDRLYLAHVLAWIHIHGETPSMDVDHVNMNPSDNRLCNLRLATRSQNMGNTRAHADSVSGLKGVYLDRKTGKWTARIYANGTRRHLGVFETAEEASAAYEAAALELFGQFARSK